MRFGEDLCVAYRRGGGDAGVEADRAAGGDVDGQGDDQGQQDFHRSVSLWLTA